MDSCLLFLIFNAKGGGGGGLNVHSLGISSEIGGVLSRIEKNTYRVVQFHGQEHVKKLFSTAVIVNEDTHWTFVRGH